MAGKRSLYKDDETANLPFYDNDIPWCFMYKMCQYNDMVILVVRL